MNSFWNNFCWVVVLFLTLSFKTQAQSAFPRVRQDSLCVAESRILLQMHSSSAIFSNNLQKNQSFFLNPLSKAGIMCVAEYKLEKLTGIPFRFRLGSLEYVNKLEGKK